MLCGLILSFGTHTVAFQSLSQLDVVPAGGSLAPSGKADRVVFKVNVELEKLEARLQYESSSAPPLALVSVEAVAVDLTVRPDTLNATASLGNLRAQDGVLPEVTLANVMM